jgi:hypothetical protein
MNLVYHAEGNKLESCGILPERYTDTRCQVYTTRGMPADEGLKNEHANQPALRQFM